MSVAKRWQQVASQGIQIEKELRIKVAQREAEIDRLKEALQQIVQWSKAYPLSVFPELSELDWAKAAESLRAGGITLDAVSASNMRHVVEGVGKIARAALEGK